MGMHERCGVADLFVIHSRFTICPFSFHGLFAFLFCSFPVCSFRVCSAFVIRSLFFVCSAGDRPARGPAKTGYHPNKKKSGSVTAQ